MLLQLTKPCVATILVKRKVDTKVLKYSNSNTQGLKEFVDPGGVLCRYQARLQAKISQTMTGWKHIALKPVDPFFSKAGAGTLLSIKVTGTRENPEFGLDHSAKPGRQTGAADRRLANY